MTEANRSRSARKLGENVVVPLLVKGDKIKLKDGTRFFYGEGFDTESEPEVNVPAASTGPIPSYGGGRRGMEMRDDPDEQEQIHRLRERGSHSSAPVTPPKAAQPRKVGRNKASRTLEPENTPPRPPSGPRAEARAAGVEFGAGAASTGGASRQQIPPGQPIVFSSGQFYRWGSWVCYFCDGVNPPGWRPSCGRPVWRESGGRFLMPGRQRHPVVRPKGVEELLGG